MTVAQMKQVGVTHDIVMVTSEMAADWLKNRRGPNRDLSPGRVLMYQADMEAGRWVFDGTPIRFSDAGLLLDGQHRLTALAGLPVPATFPFVVIQGLSAESQMVMDQPQVRTAAQNLGMRGIPNAAAAAAAAKMYLDWQNERLFKSSGRSATTKPEVEEWVFNNQELLDALFKTQFRKTDAPHSVAGGFGLAILKASPVRAHRFFDLLASGVGLPEGDPILALDRRLRNIRRHGAQVERREYLTYFIKAWNAWVTGTDLRKMQLGRYGVTGETFPALLTPGDDVVAPLAS